MARSISLVAKKRRTTTTNCSTNTLVRPTHTDRQSVWNEASVRERERVLLDLIVKCKLCSEVQNTYQELSCSQMGQSVLLKGCTQDEFSKL